MRHGLMTTRPAVTLERVQELMTRHVEDEAHREAIGRALALMRRPGVYDILQALKGDLVMQARALAITALRLFDGSEGRYDDAAGLNPVHVAMLARRALGGLKPADVLGVDDRLLVAGTIVTLLCDPAKMLEAMTNVE